MSHDPENDSRYPLAPPNIEEMRRLITAVDNEGEVFTADDLLAAMRISGEPEANARQIVAEWTSDGINNPPGRVWPEEVFLLVALAVEDRAERIRRLLRFSPERMAQALDELRRRLPQP